MHFPGVRPPFTIPVHVIMTIKKRLFACFSIALLALLFVGGFGIKALDDAQKRFENVQTDMLPSIVDLSVISNDFYSLRIIGFRELITSTVEERADLDKNRQTTSQRLDQAFAKYEAQDISNDTDRRLLEADRETAKSYQKTLAEMVTKVRSGERDSALKMFLPGGQLPTTGSEMQKALTAHVAFNEKLSADVRQENKAAYTRTFTILMCIMALVVLAVAGLSAQLYLIINHGLGGLRKTLEDVSGSLDLTRTAPVTRMDEIGRTAVAFNTLLSRVAEVVGEVRQSSGSVAVASREIAAGNLDLSARTEEQAASLQQTAASMEELTATVKQNTDSAQMASKLASDASAVTMAGSEVVQRMVNTMNDITANSTKIGNITVLIEGIAFQTNILALNAAVEAARAGEQGRGFAVVASEVRTLAQRSSAAAKEIKDLIAASVSTVRDGAMQAEEVGRNTTEAAKAVRHVTDIIGEIASASDEQSRGIEQVNQAVAQMDQVTQQNAALVEEAAAATQSLQEQANKMSDTVSAFTVGRSHAY